MGAPKKPRKKALPVNKASGTNGAWLKKMWAEKREVMMAKLHPPGQPAPNRSGVPDGMTRKQAEPIWQEAREKADYLMDQLEKAGVIAFDLNITEEEMARQTLREAFVMGMSPHNAQTRAPYMRMVLEWTKAKPASKTDLTLSTHEAWLREVLDDHNKALAIDAIQDGPDSYSAA